jgi:Asp-tRNA(Asn)/Glu-tRNA(Gln) amidotransferase A subunit family amidase
MAHVDRRQFLQTAALAGISGAALPVALYEEAVRTGELTVESIARAEEVAGVSFTPEQREMMLRGLVERLDDYAALRALDLPNGVAPCQFFDPELGRAETPRLMDAPEIAWNPADRRRPASEEDLAFSTVAELAGMLRSRQVRSVELTEMYLARLKKYGPVLEAVVTLTEERAYRRARAADAELDAGHWRGPVHGIPWGAKDLLAVAGYPTTWGAAPYREQTIDRDAAVVRRLDRAGAVLVAKLSLGALAMGDVWFGGQTKNPWNIQRGSSGSSAGPGAAVAAGLVGFAIGSETLGSIVSPSARNGVSGLRPTFGRVSRAGAMTLSWTMDKLGPMCRSAEDCALVFSVIHGRDDDDPTTVTSPFDWPTERPLRNLRVGYVKEAFERDYPAAEADRATLDVLRARNVDLEPIALPDMPLGAMLIMLDVEAAAAFDGLTLSPQIDELVRQDRGSWPNQFRQSQMIPAVEYVNASRARTLLIREMKDTLAGFDAFLSPTRGGSTLSVTNLTGHPCITIPNGFAPVEDAPNPARRNPESITIVGNLYRDAEMLALAHAIQMDTDFHRRRPPMS